MTRPCVVLDCDPGLNDANIIQQLVEAELAPGVLGRCATTGC